MLLAPVFEGQPDPSGASLAPEKYPAGVFHTKPCPHSQLNLILHKKLSNDVSTVRSDSQCTTGIWTGSPFSSHHIPMRRLRKRQLDQASGADSMPGMRLSYYVQEANKTK
ncbi:hypothetical protein PGT21_004550 [Puccinia graminis f. sp. tritici]|uniref:Uncharacterized protein n=1 Tax=Puccinia graminis f. sp. tritici TaxID=56615 RepID=A0A5B0M5Q5_PUCGR|nr:hypothetical protein PGT21_004550 [Puccinia graminis f. sp. tritici]KAA1123181.1 hypothetical protein PGTUg99_020411 [Puccinia graminis f. sp. tritici]